MEEKTGSLIKLKKGEDVIVDGNKYVGPLKRIENKLVPHTHDNENAKMIYKSCIYTGGFKNGLRESRMATIKDSSSEDMIRVSFKDDKPVGNIVIISHSAMTQYVGSFSFIEKGFKKFDLCLQQFVMDGYGQYLIYVNRNPNYYVGTFKNNMMHGYGILENYVEGFRIIGHWINDKLSGRMSKQFSDGSFFCGDYKKGERGPGGQFLFSNGFNVNLPMKKKSNVEVKPDPHVDINFLTVLKSHVKHLQRVKRSYVGNERRSFRRILKPKEQPAKYRAIWSSLVNVERLENELLASVRSFEVPKKESTTPTHDDNNVYDLFSRHIVPPLQDPNFQYCQPEEGEICKIMKMFCHHVNYSYGGRHIDRYSVGYIKMDVISFLRFFVSFILQSLQVLVDRKKENSFILKKLPSLKSLRQHLTNEVLRYIQTQCYRAILSNYERKFENKDRNLQRKLRSIYVSLVTYSKYCKYFIFGERMKYYISKCGNCGIDPIDTDTLKVSLKMNSLLLDLQKEEERFHREEWKRNDKKPKAQNYSKLIEESSKSDGDKENVVDDNDDNNNDTNEFYEKEIEIIEDLNLIYKKKLDRILETESVLCRDHRKSIVESLCNTKFDFKTGFAGLPKNKKGPDYLPQLKKKMFGYRRSLKCLRISVSADYFLTVLSLGVRVYKKHFGKVEEHNRCQLYLGSLIHGFNLLKQTATRFSVEEKSHMPYLCSQQIWSLRRLLNGINESMFALFRQNHEQLTFINRSISERIKSLIHMLVLIRVFRKDYFKHIKHETKEDDEEEGEGEGGDQNDDNDDDDDDEKKKKISNLRRKKLKTDKKFGEFLMKIPDHILKDLTKRAKELNLGTHDMKVEKAKVLNKMLQDLGNRFVHSQKKCFAAINLFDSLYFTFSTIFGMLRYRKFPYEREFILKNVTLQAEAVTKFCDYLSYLQFYKDLGPFFQFIRSSMDLEKEIIIAIGKKFKALKKNKEQEGVDDDDDDKKKKKKKRIDVFKKKGGREDGSPTKTPQSKVVEEEEEKESIRKSILLKSLKEETRKKMTVQEEKVDKDVFRDELHVEENASEKGKPRKHLAKKGTSLHSYTGTNLEEYLIYSDATFMQNRNNNICQILGYMDNLGIGNLGREHSHKFAGEEELSKARTEDEFDYLFDFSDLLSREFYRFLEQWLSLKIDLQFNEKAEELQKHLDGLKHLYNISDEEIMKEENDGAHDEKGILRKFYCDVRLIRKTILMFKSEDFYPTLKICETSRSLDRFISSVLLDIERKEIEKANLQLLKNVYRKNEFLDQFKSWNQKLRKQHKEELADSISRVITSFVGKNIKIGFTFEKTPLCLFALGVRRRFLPKYSLETILERKKNLEGSGNVSIELFEKDEDIIMPYSKSILILDKLEEKVTVFDKMELLREFEMSVVEEMKEISKREPPFEEDDKLPIILFCMMRSKIKHTSQYEFMNDWLFGNFNMMVARLETFLGYVKNLDVYNKDRLGQFQTVVGNILTPLKQLLRKKLAFVKETKKRDVNLWWLIELLDFVYTKVGFMDKDQMSLMVSSDSALEANQLLLGFLKMHYRNVNTVTSYIGFVVVFDPQEDSVEVLFKMKYSPQIYMNINKLITKEFKEYISFDSI